MNPEKLVINIELTADDRDNFIELKQKLGLKQNTEVLRHAIKHTNTCL